MLNVGVVGCGYWGPNLIRVLNSFDTVKVKSICDESSERLNHMKNLYPKINYTTKYSEIIDDYEINAVVIATPVNTHHPLGIQSLAAGKHTFIEKPLSNSVDKAKELLDLSNKKNLVLMVGHTFIYTAQVRKIKEIIESGDIGEVINISSRRLNLGLFQQDINVAWDLAPHDISILLYLLKERPISISCNGKAHYNKGIEDVTNITLNYDNDCFATIQSSWIDPRKIREMTIVGTKKMIVYDDLEPQEKIKILDKRVEVPPYYDTFAEFHYSYHYGDVYIPYLKQVEPLKAECKHFIDCIVEGIQSNSSGTEGMQVVQILEAASESLKKNGKSVNLNI